MSGTLPCVISAFRLRWLVDIGLATVPLSRGLSRSCLAVAATSAADFFYDGLAAAGSRVRQMTHLVCFSGLTASWRANRWVCQPPPDGSSLEPVPALTGWPPYQTTRQ
jgi:hypothetical protein